MAAPTPVDAIRPRSPRGTLGSKRGAATTRSTRQPATSAPARAAAVAAATLPPRAPGPNSCRSCNRAGSATSASRRSATADIEETTWTRAAPRVSWCTNSAGTASPTTASSGPSLSWGQTDTATSAPTAARPPRTTAPLRPGICVPKTQARASSNWTTATATSRAVAPARAVPASATPTTAATANVTTRERSVSTTASPSTVEASVTAVIVPDVPRRLAPSEHGPEQPIGDPVDQLGIGGRLGVPHAPLDPHLGVGGCGRQRVGVVDREVVVGLAVHDEQRTGGDPPGHVDRRLRRRRPAGRRNARTPEDPGGGSPAPGQHHPVDDPHRARAALEPEAGRAHAHHCIRVAAEAGVPKHDRAAHRPAQGGDPAVPVPPQPLDRGGEVVDLVSTGGAQPGRPAVAAEVEREDADAARGQSLADALHVRIPRRAGEPVRHDATHVPSADVPVPGRQPDAVRCPQSHVHRRRHEFI